MQLGCRTHGGVNFDLEGLFLDTGVRYASEFQKQSEGAQEKL
jgi:hypothetical protein